MPEMGPGRTTAPYLLVCSCWVFISADATCIASHRCCFTNTKKVCHQIQTLICVATAFTIAIRDDSCDCTCGKSPGTQSLGTFFSLEPQWSPLAHRTRSPLSRTCSSCRTRTHHASLLIRSRTRLFPPSMWVTGKLSRAVCPRLHVVCARWASQRSSPCTSSGLHSRWFAAYACGPIPTPLLLFDRHARGSSMGLHGEFLKQLQHCPDACCNFHHIVHSRMHASN